MKLTIIKIQLLLLNFSTLINAPWLSDLEILPGDIITIVLFKDDITLSLEIDNKPLYEVSNYAGVRIYNKYVKTNFTINKVKIKYLYYPTKLYAPPLVINIDNNTDDCIIPFKRVNPLLILYRFEDPFDNFIKLNDKLVIYCHFGLRTKPILNITPKAKEYQLPIKNDAITIHYIYYTNDLINTIIICGDKYNNRLIHRFPTKDFEESKHEYNNIMVIGITIISAAILVPLLCITICLYCGSTSDRCDC